MIKNVDGFLLCRPYVGILERVVGRLVKLCKPFFCGSLTHIITNKWVLLTVFAASPPIATPIAIPNFANLYPPSNTNRLYT